MSENTQNNTPKKEQYSLNDDRRVKVLSPGALVAKRFFRNRLAVVGLSILVAMFLFSFVGGLVSLTARTSSSSPTPRCPRSLSALPATIRCALLWPMGRTSAPSPEQGTGGRQEGQYGIQL